MKWEKCGLIWAPAGRFAMGPNRTPRCQLFKLPARSMVGLRRLSRRKRQNANRRARSWIQAACRMRPPTFATLKRSPSFRSANPELSTTAALCPRGCSGRQRAAAVLRWLECHQHGSISPFDRPGDQRRWRHERFAAIRRARSSTEMRASHSLPHRHACYKENDIWRMWYVSCTGWQQINGRWEPAYHVKYAESRDGIAWKLTGISCVDAGEGYAVARPCVFRHAATVRHALSVPLDDGIIAPTRTMPIDLAMRSLTTAFNGSEWTIASALSDRATGWDSEMIEYCWLQRTATRRICCTTAMALGAPVSEWPRVVA